MFGLAGKRGNRGFLRRGRGIHEFIVGFHASQDEAVAFRCPEVGPFFFVLGVDVVGEVLGPVYAAGFGVADVGYVVYVAFGGLLERWARSGWWWLGTLWRG